MSLILIIFCFTTSINTVMGRHSKNIKSAFIEKRISLKWPIVSILKLNLGNIKIKKYIFKFKVRLLKKLLYFNSFYYKNLYLNKIHELKNEKLWWNRLFFINKNYFSIKWSIINKGGEGGEMKRHNLIFILQNFHHILLFLFKFV